MKDFHIRLNAETVDKIKELANKDSRTVSAMARKILEDYFKPRIDFDTIEDYQRSLIYGGTEQGKIISDIIEKNK